MKYKNIVEAKDRNWRTVEKNDFVVFDFDFAYSSLDNFY